MKIVAAANLSHPVQVCWWFSIEELFFEISCWYYIFWIDLAFSTRKNFVKNIATLVASQSSLTKRRAILIQLFFVSNVAKASNSNHLATTFNCSLSRSYWNVLIRRKHLFSWNAILCFSGFLSEVLTAAIAVLRSCKQHKLKRAISIPVRFCCFNAQLTLLLSRHRRQILSTWSYAITAKINHQALSINIHDIPYNRTLCVAVRRAVWYVRSRIICESINRFVFFLLWFAMRKFYFH